METNSIRMLGAGVYTVAEAAAYARMHPTTLTRWLGMNPGGERVLRPEFPHCGERFITFLDFIQALSVRHIRQNLNISLPKVRDAVNKATDVYGVDFPLARRHLTYVMGRELYIKVDVPGDEKQFVASKGNQIAMRPMVDLVMQDVLDWLPSGVAGTYRAFNWEGHDIVMSPNHRFGEPIVQSCGHTAQTLSEACKTEGSFSAVAEVFGVEADEVEAAYRYYDFLGSKAAA